MSLRLQVHSAVREGRTAELEELVIANSKSVRHLVSLSYEADPEVRKRAAEGIALAADHHPKVVQSVIRRFVWAMNDESGTNALTAPDVLLAIARKCPRILLPMVPDLTRLAADEGLNEGLAATLRTLAESCPGEVGQRLERSINSRFEEQGGRRAATCRTER